MADVQIKTEVTVKMTGEEADMIAAALTLLRDHGEYVNGVLLGPEEKVLISDLRREFMAIIP